MPVDPWAATTAQEFTAQPSDNAKIAGLLTGWKGEMFDSRQSILANVSQIVADLTAKQAALEAQNAQILDLIANSVKIASASLSESAFSVPTTNTNRAMGTIAVPAGFTSAVVLVVATISVINSTTAPDNCYLTALINGVDTRWVYNGWGANGGFNTLTTSKAKVLTSLGSTIQVGCSTQSQVGTWAANAANTACVEAIAIFLR